jgi:SAM-dependent methyltransferase
MVFALDGYRSIWNAKPVLRAVYGDLFDRIAGACCEGRTLEIGSGISNLRDRMTEVITSDIQFSPNIDIVADAQRLPFCEGILSNIIMLDVLHHLEYPLLFFRSAARSLNEGGRIIMIEPAITWGSTIFYRFIHQEPVDMSVDPLVGGAPNPQRQPYESNQAVPTLIATRDRERFHALVPELRITDVKWFSFAAYPLSGGFKRWSLIPNRLAKPLLTFEQRFEKVFGSTLGFRMMLIFEKQ